ncbi:hypothetical protein [Halorubellus litoreus]|uniref:Uncharacterized protein n=1 Tax=Halorubellus litoreus TaxID=755308 RepID=A0ABD5VEF3_9EURY
MSATLRSQLKAPDLIEKYGNWSRIEHIEQTENFPGLVYIESANRDMPFSLLHTIQREPRLYVWQVLATEDGRAAMFVGTHDRE